MITKGLKGKFSFASPVNNVLDEDLEYVVTSIVEITEAFVNKTKPFETIYTPLNIGVELYNRDFINNVNIIGLKSSTGTDYFYVPESFISGTPDTSRIKYVEKILAVNIGKVPVDLSLENLSTIIKEVILELTNLNVEVASIENSGIELISEVDHQIYMNKINNMSSRSLTYRELYNDLKEKYDELWKINNNLNGAIKISVLDKTNK